MLTTLCHDRHSVSSGMMCTCMTQVVTNLHRSCAKLIPACPRFPAHHPACHCLTFSFIFCLALLHPLGLSNHSSLPLDKYTAASASGVGPRSYSNCGPRSSEELSLVHLHKCTPEVVSPPNHTSFPSHVAPRSATLSATCKLRTRSTCTAGITTCCLTSIGIQQLHYFGPNLVTQDNREKPSWCQHAKCSGVEVRGVLPTLCSNDTG